jgi:hypothetical protein
MENTYKLIIDFVQLLMPKSPFEALFFQNYPNYLNCFLILYAI